MEETKNPEPSLSGIAASDAMLVRVERLEQQLDRLTVAIGRLADALIQIQPATLTRPMAKRAHVKLDSWSTLRKAMRAGKPQLALRCYHIQVSRWPIGKKRQREKIFATWFLRYTQAQLRQGKADVLLPILEEAEQQLSAIPELEPLFASLPSIKQSVEIFRSAHEEPAESSVNSDNQPEQPGIGPTLPESNGQPHSPNP